MMSPSIATLLVTILTFPLSGQDKPVRIFQIHTYWVAPPQSLGEMITAADAVVRGRLIGASTSEVDRAAVTTARFEVLEILQSWSVHNIDSSEILVQRPGGDLDRGAYIERHTHDDYPAFERGHEYLLFLKYQRNSSAWLQMWGPSGVFDLTTGRVKSSDLSKVTRDQADKDAAEFLRLLRNFGR